MVTETEGATDEETYVNSKWNGNDFQISGIFNQALENYGAGNGFIN